MTCRSRAPNAGSDYGMLKISDKILPSDPLGISISRMVASVGAISFTLVL